MLIRHWLESVAVAALVAMTFSLHAEEEPAMSNANFADVNGQHLFYSVQGEGKPLVLLHGGVDPDSYKGNLSELAKHR